MKYPIKSTTGKLIAEIDVEGPDDQLQRLAVEKAVRDGISLNGASLYRASLDRASLEGASLVGASLNGASLVGASLEGVTGVNHWIKCIQIDKWPVTYTYDRLQIGCQNHAIEEWRDFDDRRIITMDRHALKWWRKYKGWIFDTIEMCPARATGTEA